MRSEKEQDFKLMELKGIWIVITGIAILLGPFLSLMAVEFIPFISDALSDKTMFYWGLFSTFGVFVYGPIGLIVLVIGMVRAVASNENL